MKLNRSKNSKWIFQKNISSKKLIEAYLSVINDSNINLIDTTIVMHNLKGKNGYNGRTTSGSINTMGVRFSQMCFYMFGYKANNNTFMPTQTTLNILQNKSISENMLINLFSMQYPHPYSNTDPKIKIYAGRLILKLLCDVKIDRKLYTDEYIYFIPFIQSITPQLYDELIESILQYRELSYNDKKNLFTNEDNWESLFANVCHELSYFSNIFNEFEVFELIEDPLHNNGKLFKFRHGNSEKNITIRNDACKSRGKYSGYIKLRDNLYNHANKLLNKFDVFNQPISVTNKNIYSKNDFIQELYEVEILEYLSVVFPYHKVQSDVIQSISEMQFHSKYGTPDGKSFELSLKSIFELFNESLNVEIISGSGEPDLLCIFENLDYNQAVYKITVEAKSRSSANNMNVTRIDRHRINYSAEYCIVVSPRFSKINDLDLEGKNMVSITADSLARYCSKECLSSNNAKANFTLINRLINDHLGENISKYIDEIVENEYGVKIYDYSPADVS